MWSICRSTIHSRSLRNRWFGMRIKNWRWWNDAEYLTHILLCVAEDKVCRGFVFKESYLETEVELYLIEGGVCQVSGVLQSGNEDISCCSLLSAVLFVFQSMVCGEAVLRGDCSYGGTSWAPIYEWGLDIINFCFGC